MAGERVRVERAPAEDGERTLEHDAEEEASLQRPAEAGTSSQSHRE